MKHARPMTKGPVRAQNGVSFSLIGDVLTFLGQLLGVVAEFVIQKESARAVEDW
ncbi:MAG TPA: hypothetical protein PKX28_09095 [Candidatus Hydrogenedentes bacterium]|nr:hypothetical protein [Candidatus Hydrogenedentota bacterium]HOJ70042.1 hypothetical protein [Candidatus Hydrogenedentota bacterium]HOK90538.1 hypothetical protein [Candidatus Hydrogenedentota bacterium]HPO31387.1 hypothetical protein [Candidatus Hydrogenedentota bacterium]